MIERVVFYMGLIVLIILIGYLSFQFVTAKKGAAQLVITHAYMPAEKKLTYRIKVENKGSEPAGTANVELKLYSQGRVKESGTVQFDYVPQKSSETGWIVFNTSPGLADSLKVGSVTYIRP